MAKLKVVMVDTDESFLIPLEMKFLYELDDEAELEVISDPSYFDDYFSTPKTADILLISEELYSMELYKHNITSTVVMVEKTTVSTDQKGIYYVNKYTNLDDIYGFVTSLSQDGVKGAVKKDTSVVLVTSASGGTGKTAIAMGLAANMTSRYKKVLYINAANMNSFQYWMDKESAIPVHECASIVSAGSNAFRECIKHIQEDNFDYLPSFATSLMALNADISVYEKIIAGAKASKRYDVIIVDTDASFDFAKVSLISKADRVVLVTKQGKAEAYAMNQFTKSISCNDNEKFLIVCNDYKAEEYNAITDPEFYTGFKVNESVRHIESIESLNITEMGEDLDIKKISYLVV